MEYTECCRTTILKLIDFDRETCRRRRRRHDGPHNF